MLVQLYMRLLFKVRFERCCQHSGVKNENGGKTRTASYPNEAIKFAKWPREELVSVMIHHVLFSLCTWSSINNDCVVDPRFVLDFGFLKLIFNWSSRNVFEYSNYDVFFRLMIFWYEVSMADNEMLSCHILVLI